MRLRADRYGPQVLLRGHARAGARPYPRGVTIWERLLRWEEAHRFVVDATFTALLLLVVAPASIAFGTTSAIDGSPAAVAVLTLALVVPLAWRRVRPNLSAAVVYAAALLQVLLGVQIIFPADTAVLVALYSVTVHGARWAHRVAIVGALVGSMLLGLTLAGSADVSGAAEIG